MRWFPIVLIALFSMCSQETPGIETDRYPVSQGTLAKEIRRNQTNSKVAMDAPYVLLISVDGYKYDYTEKHDVQSLAGFQVRTPHMISTFPTKTFPNHYAMVTGRYPGNNGLLSNTFYDREKEQTYRISDRKQVEDPSWYLGTPLWVLANAQEMVTASMFWVGSEAPIQGVLPTYHFKFDGSISHLDRTNKVMQWLTLPAESRPHFITLYFSFIDSIGHDYGAESSEMKEALKELDGILTDLMRKIADTELPVNVIVVSDHGMLEIAQEKQLDISEYIDLSETNVTLSMPAMVYSEDEEKIQKVYNDLVGDGRVDVYKKGALPEHFHYSIDTRIGDLVIMPKPPYVITTRGFTPQAGNSTHGWDPIATQDMGAIFYADGPAFKQEYEVDPFENIHIYPIVADILGLTFDASSIDGKMEVLQEILKD